jgi:ATP-binding cassette subfamily F protein 3
MIDMIDIKNITKSYGSKNIFDNINLKICSKDRIGLVGRNGHGKTTLLKIIMNQESYDSGLICIPKNYKISYVQQNISFNKKTVLEEGMEGLLSSEKNHHWKVEKILSGLGFSQQDLDRNPNEFSGGFQVRLNLAKVLVSEPNLLLLDEPTNYLDITSIRWIKKFLMNWSNELVVITHDRRFMDQITTHTAGIHRKKIRKIKGTTDKFYEQIAQDEEIYEKTRINDEKKEQAIFSFVERFRAKARLAGMVQSRIKTINKLKKNTKLEKIKSLDFSFISKPSSTNNVLNANSLSFAHENGKFLFNDLSFTVKPNDRICIIGKNGQGKTTLLKIIAEIIKPQIGKITYNPQITKGIFEQTNINSLSKFRTIEEEILYSNNDITRYQARSICGLMMFEGDLALKKISVLSGGEKSRVMLGKLLVTPINLLLLDEPTNHLDMDSCDALLSAIDNFVGTVIMVTHNEMFLHAIAERLIIFDDYRVTVFEGTYQKFLLDKGWKDESKFNIEEVKRKQKNNKKNIRNIKSKIVLDRSKKINPIKQNIIKSENIIDTYETKLDKVHNQLIKASEDKDIHEIQLLSKKAHSYKKIIEEQFDRLEKLEYELDIIKINFSKKLLSLNF